MEWVVGQWVEWSGRAWKVIEPHRDGVSLEFQDGTGALQWVGEYCTEQPKPFAWQVGKTYKTTLEGVTATITASREDGLFLGHASSDVTPTPWIWQPTTGRVSHWRDSNDVPHLLPYLADEPSQPEPTLAERYTVEQAVDGWLIRDHQDGRVAPFSTQDDAEYAIGMIKDGEDVFLWSKADAPTQPPQPDPINPPHYRDNPSGIECIQVAEHMPYCLGNAIKYLWRAGKKGDAVEDLRKAAWYINREIERLTKGGAE